MRGTGWLGDRVGERFTLGILYTLHFEPCEYINCSKKPQMNKQTTNPNQQSTTNRCWACSSLPGMSVGLELGSVC